jgi:ethanolamine utilization protein EutN
MLRATVVGPVWATKRVDKFPVGALLEVECATTGNRYVALDVLGTGPGEHVLVTTGSSVAQHFSGTAPVDAMIVGVIDQNSTAVPDNSVGTGAASTRKAQR